ACIDDNLDMVEFLVDQGTDVNRGDMEGWTPLHATASCGFNSIAKFLIDRGADLSLVNNDGDLAIDIADSDEMENLLKQEIDRRGIDCDASRNREEQRMLEDAQHWLTSGYLADRPHPKTGATALHVAAAKGYIKVLNLLLEAGADINAKDVDGWTPLHAAAHWGQQEAVEILCENMCDMDARNFVGQSAFDVGDSNLLPLMDELKRNQKTPRSVNQNRPAQRRRKTSPHRDHSNRRERDDQRESDGTSGGDESSSDVACVRIPVANRTCVSQGILKESSVPHIIIPTSGGTERSGVGTGRTQQQSRLTENNAFDQSEVQSWRRPPSLRRPNSSIDDKSQREDVTLNRSISTPGRVNSKEAEDITTTTTTTTTRRTTPTTTTTTTTPATTTTAASITTTAAATTTIPSTPEKDERNHLDSMVSSGSALPSPASTASTSPPTRSVGRSFVPPSRDEESETQRKAHAKKVRSTRRSTQGVTLDEIKSAEQLIKNKQQLQNTSSPDSKESSAGGAPASPSSAKPKPDSPTKGDDDERRPSWRLKVDDTDKNRFSLENVRTKEKGEGEADADTPTVTVQLRKKNTEERPDDEKEGERNSQTREGTQAAIQRRKKPKRRSTGRVQVNMDDIDPEKRAQRQQQQGQGDEGSEEEEEEDAAVMARSSFLYTRCCQCV
ncbi:hypothetical protein Pcinc_042966, partial [Petrolisthes cinctipes]